ncbi:MAG: hypothetical protein GY870_02895 [archaeon]|nr:hypothetical protein [archaeon]
MIDEIDALKELLFGQKQKRWKPHIIRHLSTIYHISSEIKGKTNLGVDVKKIARDIGKKNILKLLLMQLRMFDEMAKINKNYEFPDLSIKYKTLNLLPDVSEIGMSSSERFDKALNLKEADRIPICPLMDYYYAANNGLSPRDFVLAPFDLVTRAVRNTYNKFNGYLDMVHVPMGRIYAFMNWLPLAASGFYNDLIYTDDVPSTLQFIEKGYINIDDFSQIRKFGLKSYWKPVNLKKIRDTQADLFRIMSFINYWESERKVPIYATSGTITPIEGLCYLMGISNWSRSLRNNREELKELCDLLLKASIANNKIMHMFSNVKRTYICLERVSPEFLSPKNFEYFVLPHLLELVKDSVNNGLTIMFHLDTRWDNFYHYFLDFPKNGKYILHLENSDIKKAKDVLGSQFCIMGNIPSKLLTFGTEHQIVDRTKQLIDECGDGGGYMMSAGCHVTPDTPMKNLNTWINTTLKYGMY